MQKPGLVTELPVSPLDLPASRHPDARHVYAWLTPLLLGPLLLLTLKLVPSIDQVIYHSPAGHALISGAAATLGAILALLVLRIAHRAQDGRVFLTGLGFLCTASIFFIHAIATPDVLFIGRDLATSLSAPISLMSGGALFALSGLNLSPRVDRWLTRHARGVLVVFLAGWLSYGWVMLFWLVPASTQANQTSAHSAAHGAAHGAHADGYAGPVGEYAPPADHSPPVPTPTEGLGGLIQSTSARRVIGLIGLALYVFAVTRHMRLYLRAPSVAGLAIICGIGLFGQALLTQLFATNYTITFWLYHVQEFCGFGVISYGVLVAYRRGLSEETLLESLFLTRTSARIQARYARVLDTLVEALSRGARPTPALHTALSTQFGFSESQIRVLEHAALAVATERQQRHELERLNAELRELERSRDQLTQMVVHDLKNPLTALVGFLEMVRLGPLTEDQSQALEGALRSGKNLNGLISDLLDIGRMESGRMELERSLFLPLDLLTSSAAELSGWLQQTQKQVRVEVPDELPLINGDMRLLRRVLLNLISNAIKHTPAGTTITLRASACETPGGQPCVTLEVADNGPGVPPALRERIFEQYVGSGGESGGQRSTGLGLTFCRLAVEAHGGTIELADQPQPGATFRIRVPGERLEA
ncbi:MAG TPA: ATP-binding protein [Roseiflexaceae bacterium]|nr:ATP-binding protein [Roseiflexaceae bacterium]